MPNVAEIKTEGGLMINRINTAINISEKSMNSLNRSAGTTPSVVVVTCMDFRLTDVLERQGLNSHEANVIRNAGCIVNDDALRSIIVSTRLLGSKEIRIIVHTDCGMQTFEGPALDQRLRAQRAQDTESPSCLYSLEELEANTREQVKR